MACLICDYFAEKTVTSFFVILPFYGRELVGDFGGEDGTKSVKVFSKPSTQARVSASEKGREAASGDLRVLRPPRQTLEREVCVWRPTRLTLEREVCVS